MRSSQELLSFVDTRESFLSSIFLLVIIDPVYIDPWHLHFRYGVAEARARQLAEARNLRLEAPYEVRSRK